MDPEKITNRQGFFLLFLFLMANLVTANGAKGKQAGWILFLGLTVISIPLFLLYMKASRQRNAGKIFPESLGKPVGIVVTLLYCVLAILLAGDSIRLFADFIVINDLNDAGAWGNSALLTVAAMMLLYCNMRSLGKAAWAIQPLTVVFLLLSIALTAGKMDLTRLLPLFAEDLELLAKSGIGSLGGMIAPAFFPIFTLGSFAPKNWGKGVLAAGVSVCLLMALLTLRDAAVLGFPAVEIFRFPSFEAAGMFRHSEMLISAIFVLSQPFRTALCLRYALECLMYWKPRWRNWYPPVLLALSILSGTLSWSSEQVRWRTAGEVSITLILIAGPLAVIIADRIKARKAKA